VPFFNAPLNNKNLDINLDKFLSPQKSLNQPTDMAILPFSLFYYNKKMSLSKMLLLSFYSGIHLIFFNFSYAQYPAELNQY